MVAISAIVLIIKTLQLYLIRHAQSNSPFLVTCNFILNTSSENFANLINKISRGVTPRQNVDIS